MSFDAIKEILDKKVKELRGKSFDELNRFSGSANPEILEFTSSSGDRYLIETFSFIEDKKKQHLRVVVNVFYYKVDENSKQRELSDDFIINPEGQFIGE